MSEFKTEGFSCNVITENMRSAGRADILGALLHEHPFSDAIWAELLNMDIVGIGFNVYNTQARGNPGVVEKEAHMTLTFKPSAVPSD